ncbi:phosphopyruvate hydratase [Streptomyces sp. NPDC057582]|uniref:phosphopyruvate hydratase n=1 Tax=Streptomyces sp. NPDC057582 TaxID=3346174 RepID=UPI0036933D9F
MTDTRIKTVVSWEALDSRGTPTVACEVQLRGGAVGQATVPSGASTGRHEAVELRDGGARYAGRAVTAAVANAVGVLAEAVHGLDAVDQAGIDAALTATDSSEGLARVGANAVLAVSVAAALAAAQARGLPLYQAALDADTAPLLPLPMINIVSGGAHAGGTIDLQDILVVPIGASSFRQALEWSWRVRRATAEVAERRGLSAALVADEGGLAFPLAHNRDAFELVTKGITTAGLVPGVDAALAVDVAATQFLRNGKYILRTEDRALSSDEFLDEITAWAADFPIVSYEDVLGEDDWDGWLHATARLGPAQLLGDDLFVTNEQRLRRGIDNRVANAVLVKPNQIGTLSQARAVVDLAHGSGYRTVLSARSGETEDSWLADLAVGWRTGQIKVGSTMRSERTAKWNRLLRIEHELGDSAEFAGAAAILKSA